ncbi:hypothetical protein SAMN05660337_1923 [Maridesulfovibrio ferrireducens]|uniref:Uncharacterized protein n=1 Tax=Maridesulfovibrio ferrireducens TaxID=246191 RepID=A0A1G9GXU8_9BACT|nr:hypothetical protein [Maridesulfovibrio ferrireducens]SDL05518.1 hypothetical protein SAMN05660337_1923 [Maridesulfovibrio ferrireducens]
MNNDEKETLKTLMAIAQENGRMATVYSSDNETYTLIKDNIKSISMKNFTVNNCTVMLINFYRIEPEKINIIFDEEFISEGSKINFKA